MKNNRTFLEKLLDGAEVEWKSLSLVTEMQRGKTITAKSANEGKIPVISGGQKPAYYHSESNRDGKTITVAGSGAYAGYIMYWEEPIFVSDAFSIKTDESLLQIKYVYHFLLQNQKKIYAMKKGSGVPHVYPKDIGKLTIPIPSLPVQTEIVRILDALTALTSELTLRQKQYQYYREKLLSFDSLEKSRWGVKKKLSDVAIYAKVRISADKLNKENYVGVENLLQNKLGKTSSNYVPTEGAFIEYLPNDILIGNIRPYLRKIWLADRTGGTNGDVLVIRLTDKNILPRYLYHILANEHFFEYNVKYSKGAKMPRGDKAAILQYEFDIPLLEEQQHIVSILDKFETLTNSITEGLPLAIKQSQKRYEYYRELLLNFS